MRRCLLRTDVVVAPHARDRFATFRRQVAGAALLLCLVSGATAAPMPLAALADLSLEELSNLTVTSVSRREESLARAPASIYVITNEAIRRSGATTLPEALRLAPNLQVAQINAAQWAISARGFNSSIANKLLVLIDGRTIYSPLYSGVFWDEHDVMLEDVDRIEVISGPGGTLWGANAVNGVINVITRPASETQGVMASMGGGNRELSTAFRAGGAIGGDGHLRVYGKAMRLKDSDYADDSPLFAGLSARDGWDRGQAGFRADWQRGDGGFTLQGDAYDGSAEARRFAGNPPIDASGMNLLARWNRLLEGGSELQVQAYYQWSDRDDNRLLQETAQVYDVEAKHSVPFGAHRFVWGGGYRHAREETEPNQIFQFIPARRELNWSNVFAQGDIALPRDFTLTVGTRFERNHYTGWEMLPNARLGWQVNERNYLWTAVSRAVRAPARLDRDTYDNLNLPFFVLGGGQDFHAEEVTAYELGYRASPLRSLSLSVTAFYHEYDELKSAHRGPIAGFPITYDNAAAGRVKGIEAWSSWQATRAWRLSAGLLLQDKDLHLDDKATHYLQSLSELGADPNYQWTLRSSYSVTAQQELDIFVRRVGALPEAVRTGAPNFPHVDAYTAVDARYAWRPYRELELSVLARNIFDDEHVEFLGDSGTRVAIPRSIFVQAVWQP